MSDMFRLSCEGAADRELVERALEDANNTFNGSNINTAVSFAVTFLVSMIVIYERATDQVGQLDLAALTDAIADALEDAR